MWRHALFHPVMTQLMKFTIVGIASSVVNFIIVVLLVETIYLAPLVANIFAFFLAFIVSYFGHRYWTFAHKSHRFSTCMPKFLSVALLSLTLNESFYYLILKNKIFSYQLSLIIVIILVACLTFTLSKLWAFRINGER